MRITEWVTCIGLSEYKEIETDVEDDADEEEIDTELRSAAMEAIGFEYGRDKVLDIDDFPGEAFPGQFTGHR